jgi:hypothetical protein
MTPEQKVSLVESVKDTDGLNRSLAAVRSRAGLRHGQRVTINTASTGTYFGGNSRYAY